MIRMSISALRTFILIVANGILILSACKGQIEGKHLFILSGQSNMALLDPEESFNPIIEDAFGKENVIVVKHTLGGRPIREWFREWKPPHGDQPKTQPHLYDSLMNKVFTEIENKQIATITFIWMQGERDAREKLGGVYKKSLIGLYQQLSTDLNRRDVNFVIGRLSDFDMNNAKYPHWTMVRDIQVHVANSNPIFSWIDTDDLNDGLNNNGKNIKNDLHMSVVGYHILGKRFAEKSIELIEANK